jgi:hypothetical protein
VKGATWEREVAKMLAEVTGSDVRRGLGQTRSGGEVPDVVCPPYWVECKRGARTSPKAALEQAVAAMAECGSDVFKVPVAVCKDDRRSPTVTMFLSDWLDMVRRLGDA